MFPFVSEGSSEEGLLCLTGVNDHCQDAHIPYTDFGFEMYVSSAVYVLSSFVNISLVILSQNLSENAVEGLNALKCGAVFAADNIWHFIASLWWFLTFFGAEGWLQNLLYTTYPKLCTCAYEVDLFAVMLGGPEDLADSYEFCSEKLREEAMEQFSYREESQHF